MELLRTYIINMLAVILFSALCEMFLPEGNMKKYASSLIGLAVMAALISPLAAFTGADINLDDYIPASAAVNQDDSAYRKRVSDEYRSRVCRLIESKSDNGVRAEVDIGDDGVSIKRVYLYGRPGAGLIAFIINELGVLRNDIEIRNG